MARPLRIEFCGAVYHVTSRGDRREPIFVDNEDRLSLLQIVAQALARFDAQALACCLMGNHYRFVLHNAHTQSAMSMSAIAREPGLSLSRASRFTARAEQAKGKA